MEYSGKQLLQPKIAKNLPAAYQKTVFSPHRRKALICQCLRNLDADAICLQEVDFDDVGTTLKSKGFVGVETPRSQKGGGIGGRVDSCVIYVRDADWNVLEDELIRLDDLAFLSSDNTVIPDPNSMSNNCIQGIQQSFLRRNVALLVRIQHRRTQQTVVVANAHLFWHPGFEYVKVCQAHYILTRAQKFCKKGEPFLFAGDLNSRPGGATHSYLTHSAMNFKIVAPWYNEQSAEDDPVGQIVDDMGQLVLSNAVLADKAPSSPRYLLDFTLNKLCRWLRVLGIDAELETEEEERLRTTTDKVERRMIILERCRKERRTLVTTSNRLLQRKDCPSSAYCISPAGLRNLEAALAEMLVTHGVVLEPSKFLSRCVVCNGIIVSVEDPSEAKKILIAHDAPETLIHDAEEKSLEMFQCDGCRQPYWWCDIPTSSASRVKMTATRLLDICVRAGVPYSGSLGIFDHVPIDRLNAEGCILPDAEAGNTNLQQRLDVIEWLKCENIICPFTMESAYARKDNVLGELLPFTNVTDDFVDTLDYIFFDASKLKLTHQLSVPRSLHDLNPSSIARGHLLPSNLWPSDHLAVGSRFVLTQTAPTLLEQTAILLNPSTTDRVSREDKQVTFPIDLAALEFCQTILSNNEKHILSEILRNEDQQDTRVQGANRTTAITDGKPVTSPMVNQQERSGSIEVQPLTENLSHDNRCACGCVPKIPSLFEMAELRRQAKLRAKA